MNPDEGLRFASISDSIRVSVLSVDQLVDVAPRNVARSLSDDECRQYLHVDACS